MHNYIASCIILIEFIITFFTVPQTDLDPNFCNPPVKDFIRKHSQPQFEIYQQLCCKILDTHHKSSTSRFTLRENTAIAQP